MALPAQAPLYRVLVLARYEFPFHLWLSNAFEAQLGEHAPARLSVVMLCDASVAGSLERDKLEARKYEKIIGFAKYEVNGCVELTAYEEHRASPFAAVVSQAEQDVLRAARLREFFGLASTENVGGAIGVAQATLFRDKVAMKRKLQCAAELGVELPDFAVLDGASALVRFLAEHRFPEVAAVVKPICGMGSISTTVLRSAADVQALLRGGLSATVDGAADLEVESFVSGQMYHIDGFMERGTVRLIWPSRYVNSTCRHAPPPRVARRVARRVRVAQTSKTCGHLTTCCVMMLQRASTFKPTVTWAHTASSRAIRLPRACATPHGACCAR